MKRFAFFIGFFLLFSGFVFSQTKIAYSGDSGYTLVERTNLRRYVNGKYSGLTSREVRSFISRSFAPEGVRSLRGDRWYDGNFFVMEETLRNSKATMAGIHEAIPSVFKISADGKMTMFQDNGYPTFRSFPSYPAEKMNVGDSWKGEGVRTVDPMNKGIFTRIPILVLYTFEGEEDYKGERVFRIKAIWQTNYLFSNLLADPKGDSSLKKGTGGHKADILVRASTGEAILITDNVDETFTYADGTQVNLKGNITLFTEYPPAIDRDKLIFALNRIASAKENGSGSTGTAVASAKGSGSTGADAFGKKTTGSTGTAVASAKGSGSTGADAFGKKTTGSTGTAVASAKGSGLNGNLGTTESGTGGSFGSTGSLSGSSGAKSGSMGTGTGGFDTDVSGIDSGVSGNSALKEKIASSKGSSFGGKSSASGSQGNGGSGSESDGDDKNNMVFEETPAGIRLSVRDIRFKPDSDEVLGTERNRLDEIAEVLKLAPNSQFLIEGHTASVGKPAGEQKLSEQRAKKIAVELSKRGIAADRFICKGHGGNKPIASNSTDSGRAQNRRVEITILE